MKKHSLFRKTTTYLLSIGMSIFILMGCQSNANNTSQANGKNPEGNRPSQEQMKERIQDSIQPLITAGTITQEQADKIIAAYSTRPSRSQQNKTQDKQQNDQQNNQQSNNENSSQDNNETSNQNRQRFNPLSDLVTNGVITQAQADAVTEKIRGNSPRKNDGQNSQNNNTQSSN